MVAAAAAGRAQSASGRPAWESYPLVTPPASRSPALRSSIPFAFALRSTWRDGYRPSDLRRDALAGVVVGIVALPLSMSLAIACNVPPEHGLYTAIVAGVVIALTGGSPVQVSGPTAAFVAVLAPITLELGLRGLLLATLLAGVILVAMGVAGLGRLIQFIPHPVISGFTAGIAVVIAVLQLRDFFGFELPQASPHALERLRQYAAQAGTLRPGDAAIGFLTLGLLVTVPRVTRALPAPLIALALAAAVAAGVAQLAPDWEIATIASRFGGIPRLPPTLHWPWEADAAAAPIVLTSLLGPAFAIAMLGAIESLLSAVVAEGMTGRAHDPDAELVGQGLGNIVAPFFGGFAATGAIARTATGVRAGARSPLAAVFHAVFVLATMLVAAPLLGYLPMAALAALLLLVAWNMSDARHVLRTLRIAPRSDVGVLLACFLLTVALDMVWAIAVGVVLAALLFMRRMAELATIELCDEQHPARPVELPPGLVIYRIGGPLFFGAAEQAARTLRIAGMNASAVLLDLRGVPHMDATGLVNLESALNALHAAGRYVIIAGIQPDPLRLMARAGWKHRPWLTVLRSFDDGLALARALAPSDLGAAPPRPAEGRPLQSPPCDETPSQHTPGA